MAFFWVSLYLLNAVFCSLNNFYYYLRFRLAFTVPKFSVPPFFTKETWNIPKLMKLGMFVAFATLVAILVAPSFSLVPPRYREGELITRTIVVTDSINLRDERSTQSRIEEALKEAPPVYDYDPGLGEKIVKQVRKSFAVARQQQQELEQSVRQSEESLRINSMQRVDLLGQIGGLIERQKHLNRERLYVLRELGELNDAQNLDEIENKRVAKLRADIGNLNFTRQEWQGQLQARRAKLEGLEKNIQELQEGIRQARTNFQQAPTSMQTEFEANLGGVVSPQVFQLLLQQEFGKIYEDALTELLLSAYSQRFAVSKEVLGQNAIQVQNVANEEIERLENFSSLNDVSQVREQLVEQSELLLPALGNRIDKVALLALVQSLIQPNLTENKSATEALKRRLRAEVPPVFFALKKGDVVARAGELATAQQAEIIRAFNAYNRKHPKYTQILGTWGLVLLLLGMTIYLIIPRILPQGALPPRRKLMAVLLLGNLLISQLLLLLEPTLNTVYQLPTHVYSLLLPVALTAMLASIVAGRQIGIMLGLLQALLHAILLGNQFTFFIYGTVASLLAATATNYDRRAVIWKQGITIGLANMLTTVILLLLSQQSLGTSILINLTVAFVNGLLVSMCCTALLPLIEKFFDITTNLRLLELANMNQPTLKQLAVTSPGTYQHSIVVSNLSESAAEGISANNLLVRVASYYHDLGKMKCPLYFIENQQPGLNYHQDMPPEVSARIIVNHVQDGLKIATQHNLGRAIYDIIQQHHGTSLVRFFFHKAQQKFKNDPQQKSRAPDEAAFRYRGPKPQSKEAGLVMAADMTEAATRSLQVMSPESIRDMVQDITKYLYVDGQLEESGLTFNDLNHIEKCFTRMILSVHHHRVQYPGQKTMLEKSVKPSPVFPTPKRLRMT